MKKRFHLLISLLVLLLLISGCSNEKPEDESGWHDSSQGAFYLDESATPLTGWQTIDGNHYYFHPNRSGAMVSGWLTLPQGRYYFDSTGVMQTGWQVIDGNRYYFHPDRGGAMVCGWLDLPEGRYYFDGSGIMQTGWLQLSGKQYYIRQNGVMTVGTLQIEGKDYHFTSTGEPFWLVNLNYPLPDNYQLDLVEVEGFQVSKDCAKPLLAMMEACRAAGYQCVINTAYRDRDYQQMLWDNRYNNYISQGHSPTVAAELSAQFVLPPGYSEHHTGLAVDITGTEQMYSWLEQHAPKYGFILRYPEDKTQWTGVSYEPWHFRYVGQELALELQTLDFTPEEYLYYLTEASHCTG